MQISLCFKTLFFLTKDRIIDREKAFPAKHFIQINNTFLREFTREISCLSIKVTAFKLLRTIVYLNEACLSSGVLPFLPSISFDRHEKRIQFWNKNCFPLNLNSPDATGTNSPVVLRIRSDTILETPRSAFLFAPCLDMICGTLHSVEFRRQPSPSSRLWYRQIVSNFWDEVSSSLKNTNSSEYKFALCGYSKKWQVGKMNCTILWAVA